jgi:hypothetical protein
MLLLYAALLLLLPLQGQYRAYPATAASATAWTIQAQAASPLKL